MTHRVAFGQDSNQFIRCWLVTTFFPERTRLPLIRVGMRVCDLYDILYMYLTALFPCEEPLRYADVYMLKV